MLNLLKSKYEKIHFIGIGGIGMSGIAEFLLKKGFSISGSDLAKSEITLKLSALGAVIYEGQEEKNVEELPDLVVYSSAVRRDNPELKRAKQLGIKCIKRAEMLGELTKLGSAIGIAGTHGKTSVTAMLGIILQKANLNPTVFVGGVIKEFRNTNVLCGEDKYIVVEADEYDRTFHSLFPSIAVINNIEAEHLDIYKDFDDVRNAFIRFANSIPFYGFAALNADNLGSASIMSELKCDVITYGIKNDADYKAVNVVSTESGTEFDVECPEKVIMGISTGVYGTHNVCNALAALTVAKELGVDEDTMRSALKNFKGAERRFQRIYDGEIKIIDDYAHHPTEVAAGLEAAENLGGRVAVVFQPHLYTRTRDFYADFAKVFSEKADLFFGLDVYPAREEPIEGITGKLIVDNMTEGRCKDKFFVEDNSQLFALLKENLQENYTVVFMGAGSVTKLAYVLVRKIKDGEFEIK